MHTELDVLPLAWRRPVTLKSAKSSVVEIHHRANGSVAETTSAKKLAVTGAATTSTFPVTAVLPPVIKTLAWRLTTRVHATRVASGLCPPHTVLLKLMVVATTSKRATSTQVMATSMKVLPTVLATVGRQSFVQLTNLLALKVLQLPTLLAWVLMLMA
jgi:hypothetical protein